jgi:hypothetical protein
MVARRHPGMARLERFSRLALMNSDDALLVETLGEHAGEQRRHVLHDDDGNREVRRNRGENFGERVGTSGRGTDRQNVDSSGGLGHAQRGNDGALGGAWRGIYRRSGGRREP